MTIGLTDPIFHDEGLARQHMEAIRWPNGPFCPHCGSVGGITRLQGKSHRPGLHQCNGCRGHFTITNGSVMERSHIPLTKWLMGFHLMAASKKGVAAHQLHRMLSVTNKTAWFTAMRIHEAMREENPSPLGGEGQIVEADEMYLGKRSTPMPRNKYLPPPVKKRTSGPATKREIVGLVERGGEARLKHLNHITDKNLREYVVTNASCKSRLHTDESRLYDTLGKEFAQHETVNHGAKEYARGDVTTNTVEGIFGIFKRGMVGVYQHCGEQHLQRYLDEFTFRYNNHSRLGVEDTQRAWHCDPGCGRQAADLWGACVDQRHPDSLPALPSLGGGSAAFSRIRLPHLPVFWLRRRVERPSQCCVATASSLCFRVVGIIISHARKLLCPKHQHQPRSASPNLTLSGFPRAFGNSRRKIPRKLALRP